MTPERWGQVKSVVAEALEMPLASRSEFLDRACATDEELRREVDSLLEASDSGDSVPGVRGAVANASRAVADDQDAALRSVIAGALEQNYDILRPLGRGGMGAVYLARERPLDRFVAIKVLRPDLADAAHSRERFRREARIAAQLSHPGILPLHSFGEVGGLWYFVMGYARGETLAERLRLENRIPWVEAHRILTQLTDALECAHRHGIVHRDIKPANILLDDDSGHPMLADFGISKVVSAGDSLTASGVVVGTPDYMSPEQAEGMPDVDERSDIYSLGAVAYKMLSGREPFTGTGMREVMFQRLTADPTPLKAVMPSVPDDIAAVVMKCLARNRADRWRDARELKDALVRAGANASETLPEPVRDLPSFGAYAALWLVAWTAFALMSPRPAGERALLLLIAFLVPFGLALHVWNVGRHELRATDLARVALWPPEWWSMWWPRALRRPTDLWPRLPVPARLARVAVSAFFLAVPGLIVARQWLASTGRVAASDRQEWFVLAEGAVVAVVAAAAAGAFVWARRKGLDTAQSVRLLFGATTVSASWNAPEIARLLAPASGGVRPPDRDTPADFRRAISDLLPVLPREAQDAARAAAAAADRAIRAIEERDRELRALARDAGAGEVDRLSAQLAAFGDTADETPEHRELRDLVRHQLELVRRLHARHEAVSRQRARLLDLLRGLWTQLGAVRDSATVGPASVTPIAKRVAALCAEIDGTLVAAVEPSSHDSPAPSVTP